MNVLFAWRYFRAKKSTNAINIIAWVSVGAIVIITAAFIILLSVFNGFEGLVKSLYSSFYTDIRITPKEGKSITVSESQLRRMRSMPEIAAFSLEVEEKTLLQNGDIQTIVYLKGVDSNYTKITGVAEKLIRGKFDLGDADHAGVVLGSGVENALAVRSDRALFPVTAYLFKRGVNVNVVDPYQAFSAQNIATTGTFFIQQDIDNTYAITNVAFMKRMLSMAENEFGAVEVGLRDGRSAGSVKRDLQGIFSGNYVVETRFEQNRSLYSVMTLEKWAMYGLLTLMLVVAAFTLIGALTMLVMEKRKDIQILKALGADSGRVRTIFLSEGLLLGAMGSFGGVLLAIFVAWAQVKYKLVAIEGGTFLIDYYPVDLRVSDFLLVIVTVMLITLLASWFPARNAAGEAVRLKS